MLLTRTVSPKTNKPEINKFQSSNSSNEAVLFTGVQEESLRVFFGRFLIGHFATNPDMDDYLGFTPPKALALCNGCP